MSTWGTRPVSTTQTRISSKLWGEKIIVGISEEFAHTLSLSWKICSHAFSSFEKKCQSSDRSYFKTMFSPLQWSTEVSSGASHVCTDPTRSSWFLKDFSNSKLKICFFFSLTAVECSPWSVYLLCPFKCRGYNLQSSCLKLISKTTVAFLLPPNMPNTSTIISAKSPWSFIYVYLEAWLFGLDNQTQVWCSIFQVKTT